jgi:hypothetical protein
MARLRTYRPTAVGLTHTGTVIATDPCVAMSPLHQTASAVDVMYPLLARAEPATCPVFSGTGSVNWAVAGCRPWLRCETVYVSTSPALALSALAALTEVENSGVFTRVVASRWSATPLSSAVTLLTPNP